MSKLKKIKKDVEEKAIVIYERVAIMEITPYQALTEFRKLLTQVSEGVRKETIEEIEKKVHEMGKHDHVSRDFIDFLDSWMETLSGWKH